MEANSHISGPKPPTIMLNETELADVRAQIAAGTLPSDWFAQYAAALQKNVFGADVEFDSRGQPIEKGIGSAAQPSHNSVAAFKKYCKDQPGYERDLAKMEKDLAAYLAKKAEKRR